jgi:hypothetical protein
VTDYTALFQSLNMVNWSSNIEIGRCESVNNRAYFAHVITTKNLNFHDNIIEQIPVGDKWIHAGAIFRGVQDSQFSNNTLNLKGGGRAFNGLFFEAVPPIPQFQAKCGASNVNLVIRGNRIAHTKEEGILIERSREAEESCVGDVIRATPTTLSRKQDAGYGTKGNKHWTPNFWKDRTVAIVNGKGLGQVRQVVLNSETSITIDKPWDIIPDKTSIFSVMHHSNNILIENNTVTDTGKASIAPYQCCGTVVKNNIMSLCRNHEWDTATIEMMCPNVGGEFADNDGTLWPNYNNSIIGNTITNDECMIGVRVGNTNFESRQSAFRTGISTYNILIEGNIVDMKAATNGPNRIVSGTTSFSGSVGIVAEAAYLSTLRKVVIRNNTVKNAKFGIWLGAQFESTNQGMLADATLLNNKFDACTTPIFISPGVYADTQVPTETPLKATATASSTYDRNYDASYAVDGNIANSLWSSDAKGSESPWLQLDLGVAKKIRRIEVVTRHDYDQPDTRKNFEVRGSNDATFATFTVLGKQGATPLAYKATLTLNVKPATSYRYIRIAKTQPEYFTIAEVRVF